MDKRGFWITAILGYVKCSECDKYQKVSSVINGKPDVSALRYCAWCGAKMEIEEKESEE